MISISSDNLSGGRRIEVTPRMLKRSFYIIIGVVIVILITALLSGA